jgi:membrane-associated phospholipid phosphatase
MTPLISCSDPARPDGRASARPAGKSRKRPVLESLADPKARLAIGAAATVITAAAVRGRPVGRHETTVFRAINDLPDSLYVPAWAVMQLGALGAAPVAAGGAWAAHDRKLSGRLLAGGVATWALSKLVKQLVRRPRPAMLLPGARRRGPDAAGLGYLSGHAGVAVALGAAALPRLGAAERAVILGIVPIVGLSRVYVGAHLPLDIAGGAALGLAVEAAVAMLTASDHAAGEPTESRGASRLHLR